MYYDPNQFNQIYQQNCQQQYQQSFQNQYNPQFRHPQMNGVYLTPSAPNSFNNSQIMHKKTVNNLKVKGNNDSRIIVNINEFKTNPLLATCPSCHFQGLTQVELSFNFKNYGCYVFFTPILWLIHQLYKEKDLNCNDSLHFCSSCGSQIGTYEAC